MPSGIHLCGPPHPIPIAALNNSPTPKAASGARPPARVSDKGLSGCWLGKVPPPSYGVSGTVSLFSGCPRQNPRCQILGSDWQRCSPAPLPPSLRYDLLGRLYMACGKWDLALQTAEVHDRIHLRTIHYQYARYQEVTGDLEGAVQEYEASRNHRYEVPRMLCDHQQFDELERYVQAAEDKVPLSALWPLPRACDHPQGVERVASAHVPQMCRSGAACSSLWSGRGDEA